MTSAVRATNSKEDTIAFGIELARQLRPPKLVLLEGELGAGKTTLVKGIAEGFSAAKRDDVTSPTFTLVHEYHAGHLVLYHIDLYRIDTLRELETLAMDDLQTDRSILLVEWGDKFERLVKEADLIIHLQRTGENTRAITVRASTR